MNFPAEILYDFPSMVQITTGMFLGCGSNFGETCFGSSNKKMYKEALSAIQQLFGDDSQAFIESGVSYDRKFGWYVIGIKE